MLFWLLVCLLCVACPWWNSYVFYDFFYLIWRRSRESTNDISYCEIDQHRNASESFRRNIKPPGIYCVERLSHQQYIVFNRSLCRPWMKNCYYLYDLLRLQFFQFLGGYGDRRLNQDALIWRAVLLKNSIFEKTYFFQQKSSKSIFTRHGARRGAKSWPSWRRQLTTVPPKQLWFFFSFGAPKCRQCLFHLRRFLTLHPSGEGLYGVRT